MSIKRNQSPRSSVQPARALKKLSAGPQATFMSLVVLAVFYLVVFFAAPQELPYFMQRLVGLSNALLAMLVVLFADAELGLFRTSRSKRSILSAPLVASIVFIVIFLWWCSAWAPLKVDGAGWLTPTTTTLG